MATRIDTLKTYEAIAAAGVDDKAARAISNAIADSASDYRGDLATKSDITLLKSDIESMGLRLEKAIAVAQQDTLGKFWIAVAIIVALSGGINGLASFLIARNVPANTSSR